MQQHEVAGEGRRRGAVGLEDPKIAGLKIRGKSAGARSGNAASENFFLPRLNCKRAKSGAERPEEQTGGIE